MDGSCRYGLCSCPVEVIGILLESGETWPRRKKEVMVCEGCHSQGGEIINTIGRNKV